MPHNLFNACIVKEFEYTDLLEEFKKGPKSSPNIVYVWYKRKWPYDDGKICSGQFILSSNNEYAYESNSDDPLYISLTDVVGYIKEEK